MRRWLPLIFYAKSCSNVKNVVVESHDFYTDIASAQHLRTQARPDKWHQCRCPYCGKKCPKGWRVCKGTAPVAQP